MIVRKLIEELSKMPQEAKVLTYNELTEEHGRVALVKNITSQDDMEYDKADAPEIPEGGSFVVISG